MERSQKKVRDTPVSQNGGILFDTARTVVCMLDAHLRVRDENKCVGCTTLIGWLVELGLGLELCSFICIAHTSVLSNLFVGQGVT